MRLWGHPIHPMLVHFPVAFWTVATCAHLAEAAGIEAAAALARASNGAGLIVAALAMVAGLLELRAIESRSRAMQVATWHLMAMATAWFCFLLAWLLSISPAVAADPALARRAGAVSAVAGFLLMGAGGWLGGRLVYEFGVGVRSGAKS